MASPTRFPVNRRPLRPARALPCSKPEPFAALPSVKKNPELNGSIPTHASSGGGGEGKTTRGDNDDDDDGEEEYDVDDDDRQARPTLGTMEALAFQQSILGKKHLFVFVAIVGALLLGNALIVVNHDSLRGCVRSSLRPSDNPYVHLSICKRV